MILQPFFGLNPRVIGLNTTEYFTLKAQLFVGSEYVPLYKCLCTLITAT